MDFWVGLILGGNNLLGCWIFVCVVSSGLNGDCICLFLVYWGEWVFNLVYDNKCYVGFGILF